MGRANRYVSPLRAADYLAAENAVLVYRGGGREGNCMFKHAGVYYFCSSDLHGWNASQTLLRVGHEHQRSLLGGVRHGRHRARTSAT